jgi:hypothetical protein
MSTVRDGCPLLLRLYKPAGLALALGRPTASATAAEKALAADITAVKLAKQ